MIHDPSQAAHGEIAAAAAAVTATLLLSRRVMSNIRVTRLLLHAVKTLAGRVKPQDKTFCHAKLSFQSVAR